MRRSEYLRMENGDEVKANDVTSEVTGGDVTSEVTSDDVTFEVTGGDVTSRAGVSDVSSRGTDVNSDFEVCSSPQQGREITSNIFLLRILHVLKRITFSLLSLLPQVGM